ncbi:hypothetical protein B0J17DRAFT_692392 [Rhizoctonia solani]|nr:hypothetical protein B0J17DRAFT_692392 [Rhizoctonia solani]
MTVVQTDVTAYQMVPGHGRRVVFETSTDSFIPEFRLFSEAEQRTIEALKAVQNMVRAMYAQGLEGTMEVDVRVVMEGLESVKGIDRYMYRLCFVIDLPIRSARNLPVAPKAPIGLLPPADTVSSSETSSIQYWPPTSFISRSTDTSTPKVNNTELWAHSEFPSSAPGTWPNAHRMRRRLMYREANADEGRDGKRRRLDGVEVGA